MDHFDIAIIGAGPAGCACAMALHGSGLRVVIADKAVFPRDKTCGDAIPGEAFKAMKAINPEWEKDMRNLVDRSMIHSSKGFIPNGKTITLHWKQFSYNSKRMDFDHFLLKLVRKQTETKIIENSRLKDMHVDGEKVMCAFSDGPSFSAGMVIGCDGANSVVSRQMSRFDVHKHPSCVAVRGYYKGVDAIEEGTNEFHFIREILPGYFWIFPLQNGWSNVGFGLLHADAGEKASQQKLRQTLQRIIEKDPVVSPRFKNAESDGRIRGYPLPLLTQRRKISGERFLLCGDAASLIDPLWGHGIDNAMWSGYFAAQQAILSCNSNNFSPDFMYQYDVKVYDKISKKFRRNTLILKLLSRFPFLFGLIFPLAGFDKLVRWVSRYF